MPSEPNNTGSESGDGRRLMVAMALLTREFERQRAVFQLVNRERAAAPPPDWAQAGAAVLSKGPPGSRGPAQSPEGTGKPLEVVIVGQSKTVAVHDVGSTRFGREERGEQDRQFREALFGSQKVVNAGESRERRQQRDAGGADVGAVVAKSLVSKFAVVFGPLIALSTVLGQTNSGFGVFQKTLQVFAATLAPILLPVFALLGAAVLTVSDKIWQELLPKLGDWYKWILDVGIPALEKFTKAIGNAAGALLRWAERFGMTPQKAAKEMQTPEGRKQFGRDLDPFGLGYGDVIGRNLPDPKKFAEKMDDFGKKIGLPDWLTRPRFRQTSGNLGEAGKPLADRIGPGLAGIAPGIGSEIARKMAERGGDAKAAPGGISDFQKNLKLVNQSLLQSMLPKPQYSALTEVTKQAQLAAVGQDPLDMVTLKRMLETWDKWIGAIAENTKQKSEPTFKGDF